MAKERFTIEMIAAALVKHKGFKTYAAKELGCSLSTIERRCAESRALQEVVRESRESMLDFAEGKLLTHIKENDVTSLIFYLKTKGKARGYSEKPDNEKGDLSAITELVKALKGASAE